MYSLPTATQPFQTQPRVPLSLSFPEHPEVPDTRLDGGARRVCVLPDRAHDQTDPTGRPGLSQQGLLLSGSLASVLPVRRKHQRGKWGGVDEGADFITRPPSLTLQHLIHASEASFLT